MIVDREGLQRLFDILTMDGYQIVGPAIRDNVIIYDHMNAISYLPVGWRDFQDAGMYRLEKNETTRLFDYVPGPYSWKRYLYPPALRLWRAEREDKGFQVVEENVNTRKYAFLGVRPCEIGAMAILDKVFNTDKYSDPVYNARRKNLFIVAVNCTKPGGTCFCGSMKTGPVAEAGFDIALTEIPVNGGDGFIAEAGSARGTRILKEQVAHREADEKERDLARGLLEDARCAMGRSLDTSNLKAIFYEHFEHPQWEELAERCLTCGNCTMVCPTCFCYNIEDANDLTGAYAERRRKWDSCFNKDFSYMHGGSIRFSGKSRYRQWLTHKLATWVDQFGTSGCVGCGRCITWCPVGIDLTEESKKILDLKECSHEKN